MKNLFIAALVQNLVEDSPGQRITDGCDGSTDSKINKGVLVSQALPLPTTQVLAAENPTKGRGPSASVSLRGGCHPKTEERENRSWCAVRPSRLLDPTDELVTAIEVWRRGQTWTGTRTAVTSGRTSSRMGLVGEGMGWRLVDMNSRGSPHWWKNGQSTDILAEEGVVRMSQVCCRFFFVVHVAANLGRATRSTFEKVGGKLGRKQLRL